MSDPRGLPAIDRGGVNAPQIEYWNDVAGAKWVAKRRIMDDQIGAYGEMAMDKLDAKPGEHILEVGCGSGTTSMQLADRVGDAGRITACDISAPMIGQAMQRADEAGYRNIEFLYADAAVHEFEPGRYNKLYSRFGVMFFVEPVAAFKNLARALKPGAALAFVCWQIAEKNPWMGAPAAAVADIVDIPPRPDPNPFSFGEPSYVEDILSQAGFRDIEAEGVEQKIVIGGRGGTAEDAIQFVSQFGPAAEPLSKADEKTWNKAHAALYDVLKPCETPDGVMMDSAVWIVTARR